MFEIRFEGKQPIYEQICDQVAALITSGVLLPGERLPTVRETAKANGINPNTVQKAYNLLEQKGFIYSVPAKGSYVSDSSETVRAMLRKTSETLENAMKSARKAGMDKDAAQQILDAVWKD